MVTIIQPPVGGQLFEYDALDTSAPLVLMPGQNVAFNHRHAELPAGSRVRNTRMAAQHSGCLRLLLLCTIWAGEFQL